MTRSCPSFRSDEVVEDVEENQRVDLDIGEARLLREHEGRGGRHVRGVCAVSSGATASRVVRPTPPTPPPPTLVAQARQSQRDKGTNYG